MTDPARWSGLNESEREVLLAAQEYPTNLERMVAASEALDLTDPPPAQIEMPDGWDQGQVETVPNALAYEYGETVADVRAVLALALRSAGWRVEAPRG